MKVFVRIIKFIALIICHIWGKIQWWLHKLFPKHIAILTCYGCMNDECPYRSKKGNMICYYHKKKNRKIKTLADLATAYGIILDKGDDKQCMK